MVGGGERAGGAPCAFGLERRFAKIAIDTAMSATHTKIATSSLASSPMVRFSKGAQSPISRKGEWQERPLLDQGFDRRISTGPIPEYTVSPVFSATTVHRSPGVIL